MRSIALLACCFSLLACVTTRPTDAPLAQPTDSPEQVRRARLALCGDAESATARAAQDELVCGDYLLEQDGPVPAIERWHNAYLSAADVATQCGAIQRIKQNSMNIDTDMEGVPALAVQRCGELAAEQQRGRAARQLQAAVQSSCRASCSSQYNTCVASAEGLLVLSCDDAKRACLAGCQ